MEKKERGGQKWRKQEREVGMEEGREGGRNEGKKTGRQEWEKGER